MLFKMKSGLYDAAALNLLKKFMFLALALALRSV